MNNRGNQQNEQRHSYNFDSSNLEKAAQAAKYLDGSKNAKEAFELSASKEKTRQLELEESKM